jgi:hypothetical protein
MEKFDGCQTSEIIANFYLTQTTFLYPLHYSIKYNKIPSLTLAKNKKFETR